MNISKKFQTNTKEENSHQISFGWGVYADRDGSKIAYESPDLREKTDDASRYISLTHL